MKNYFLMSPSRDGWRNLALDEHLLNTLSPDDAMLLLYINNNAVIIGRNQNPWRECNLDNMEADSVKLVRRCSGGGAVYHDGGNLNFSFIAHESRYNEKTQTELILKALWELGITAEFTGRNDLTVAGKKFSGNAFCSRGENRLRHGTLLVHSDLSKLPRYLNVSPQKLQSKGVASVRSRVCNLSEFCPGLNVEQMAGALSSSFGVFEEYRLTPADEEAISDLYARNASWGWCMGKAPSFDYTVEERFDWGGVELCFTVVHGCVVEAVLYTDALDISLPEKVAHCLSGLRFHGSLLSEKLRSGGPELIDLADRIKTWNI